MPCRQKQPRAPDSYNVNAPQAHEYTAHGLNKIRNPHGKREWQGDWSDKSSKWTERIKNELEFERKNDGVFWISFEDFMNFFYTTTICLYNKKYEDTFIADQHAFEKIGMLKMTNPKLHNSPISFTAD